METNEIFAALKAPFTADAIEWRVGQAGTYGEGKIWAKVLAYLTSRAVMDRLDDVVGPQNWKAEYFPAPHDPKGESLLCTLSLRIAGEWIGKTDGASASEIEGTKGGISDSLKRAAVTWGIGRYLYKLGEAFAVDVQTSKPIQDKDEFYYAPKNDKKNIPAFYWKAPHLPGWALPDGSPPPPSDSTKAKAANVAADVGALTAAELVYVTDGIKTLESCKTRGEYMDTLATFRVLDERVKAKIRPTVEKIGKKFPPKSEGAAA